MNQIDADHAGEIIDVAEALADAAGQVILPYFRRQDLKTENKSIDGFDPVTVADRAAERVMRDLLAERRPHDAVHGEEYGTSPGTSGLTWVLDPIDGTRGFMSGTPTWGVLIALREPAGPLYGVIDQPFTRERFRGGFGRADFTSPHGSGALGVRATTELDQSILFTTFPEVGTREDRAGFERVAARTQLVRYGMDCYAYALLAAGQIDLVIEAGLQTYDIMAPIALIKAAGGIVTNWEGGPVHDGGRALAAATPELHAAALDLLQSQQ